MENTAAEQYGFQMDADRCIGCKACVVACNDNCGHSAGVSRRHVVQLVTGGWSDDLIPTPKGIFSFSLSSSCHHCSQPACMGACPQRAIVKDEHGIVYIQKEICVGCGACVKSCPHGAIQLAGRTADKCDLCREELTQGREPICVRACPMRCLHWGPIEQLKQENKEGRIFPAQSVTCPNFLLVPHRGMAGRENRYAIRSMTEEL